MSVETVSPSQGLVIVYTGDGKGKTTAALGLAVRALGHGWRVCMVQFVKGSWRYGELEGVKRLAPNFELVAAGEGFVGILDDEKPLRVHREAARRALELGRKRLMSSDYQIVILDEINYALHLRLIRLKDILDIIRARPSNVTLVLTGDHAHLKVIKIADLVTEMRQIKHPFEKGISAIRGIDF